MKTRVNPITKKTILEVRCAWCTSKLGEKLGFGTVGRTDAWCGCDMDKSTVERRPPVIFREQDLVDMLLAEDELPEIQEEHRETKSITDRFEVLYETN